MSGFSPQGVHNGTGMVAARAPVIFKSVSGSGTITLWTPSAARLRFRLLAYRVMLTGDVTQTVAGRLSLQLKDGASVIGQNYEPFVPSAAPTSPLGLMFDTGLVNLGALGVLSAVANNALTVALGASLTAGLCRAMAWGTEE